MHNVQLSNVTNNVLPNRIEPVTAIRHLRNGIVFRPALDRDAIHRAHQSRSIGTLLAMDQNGCPLLVGYDLKKAYQFLLFGMPRLHVKMLVREPRIPNSVSVRVKGAQVKNCHHSQFFDLVESVFRRLSTAINIFGDLKEIRNTIPLDWLRPVVWASFPLYLRPR
jgi:hypothetical protein